MLREALQLTTLLLHWAVFLLVGIAVFYAATKVLAIAWNGHARSRILHYGHEAPSEDTLESFLDEADALGRLHDARRLLSEVRRLHGVSKLNHFHLHWISRVLYGEISPASRPPRYAPHRMTA